MNGFEGAYCSEAIDIPNYAHIGPVHLETEVLYVRSTDYVYVHS